MSKERESIKIENQVVCRELSQKIEKLGVKQESLWYWNKYYHSDFQNIENAFLANRKDEHNGYCSAFTVAELGEMLPDDCLPRRKTNSLKRYQWHSTFCYPNPKKQGAFLIEDFIADTEADCRAKMLIYLIEKGLMKI